MREKGDGGERSLRRDEHGFGGKWLLVGVIVLVGIFLIVIGAGIVIAHPTGAWAPPTAYILFGLAVISIGMGVGGPKQAIWIGLLLAIVATIIELVHLLGAIPGW
jgi:hypothetical protein